MSMEPNPIVNARGTHQVMLPDGFEVVVSSQLRDLQAKLAIATSALEQLSMPHGVDETSTIEWAIEVMNDDIEIAKTALEEL